jgi:molybdopterin-guanine dinucleotide biosynthesis protein A
MGSAMSQANELISSYVLAGGASARFGQDKALAILRGKTLLERMSELSCHFGRGVRVVAPPGRYSIIGAEVVADRWPGEGPLGGIITALWHAKRSSGRARWLLIVGCDMPFLTRDWLSFLVERALTSNADAVVPRSPSGLEPLCACWRTAAMDSLQTAFDEGVRKLTDGIKRMHVDVLDEGDWKRFDNAGRLFWNMNTQQDYEEAARIWEQENL